MCGRFAIFSKPEDYLDQLGVDGDIKPCAAVENYNAYPTQDLPVVFRDSQHQLQCDLLHWGLIPSWAKDPGIGFKTSNARSETAADKPSFRHAYRHQRCLVPVDGWYEWKREGKNKQPFFHHLQDGKVIWLAGLWEHWLNPESGEPLLSFTLLTRDAKGNAEKIHDRMPVVMNPQRAKNWLDNTFHDRQGIESMMHYLPDNDFEIYPVTRKMNSPKFQGVECMSRLSQAENN